MHTLHTHKNASYKRTYLKTETSGELVLKSSFQLSQTEANGPSLTEAIANSTAEAFYKGVKLCAETTVDSTASMSCTTETNSELPRH